MGPGLPRAGQGVERVSRWKGLQPIGVDEIAWQRGGYLTFVALDAGLPGRLNLWALGQERKITTLESHGWKGVPLGESARWSARTCGRPTCG